MKPSEQLKKAMKGLSLALSTFNNNKLEKSYRRQALAAMLFYIDVIISSLLQEEGS